MNLVIDIGNTRTKAGIFEKDRLVAMSEFETLTVDNLKQLVEDYPAIKNSILSSVSNYESAVQEFLKENFKHIGLSHQLSVPIKNGYATPETLGNDRLAVAVAANHLFPNKPNLVIDAGTCITFDFVDAHGIYKGGAILPGIEMKFKALHTFTAKLPLLSGYKTNTVKASLVGNNTEASIFSGVLNGTLFEIEGFCQAYKEQYNEINIIFTGGDHKYFVENLNFKTFAEPNLLLKGLNIILNFNVEQQSY